MGRAVAPALSPSPRRCGGERALRGHGLRVHRRQGQDWPRAGGLLMRSAAGCPEIGGYLTPGHINSRKQTVIAGASDAVDRAVDYFNKLGMTAQAHPGIPCLFTARCGASLGRALPHHLRDGDRLPRIPLVGLTSDGELYPTHDMDTSSGALADQMASSGPVRQGRRDLLPRRARIFVEVAPSARSWPWPKDSRRQGRRHLLFPQTIPSAAGAFLPRSHVQLLRCGHSPPRKSLGCCGSDAARSCRTSRRHARPSIVPTSSHEHPRP